MKAMGTTTKTLYDTDFVAWADETAGLIRAHRLDGLDLEHVAEEIEGLAVAKRKAIRSQLRLIMSPLIKQKIQPERDIPGWQVSIANARKEILNNIEEAPSLRKHLEESVDRVYSLAVRLAVLEAEEKNDRRAWSTCPWTLDKLLHGDPAELALR
jgi:hypothetical protein